jgi:hypothetical protein
MNEADHSDDLAPGGLWRDVLNFLGDRDRTPSLLLPLADAVLPKWARWTYFMGHAARMVAEERAELEADVARSEIGWRLWTERRDALRTYAERIAERPVTDDELENWWASSNRGEWRGWDGGYERDREFARLTGLSKEDLAVIRDFPKLPNLKHDRWSIGWLHRDLEWVVDLADLGRIARKTWPPDPADRKPWSVAELTFVNAYFGEQEPRLYAPGDDEDDDPPIDPLELRVLNDEQNLGIGLDGLHYVMYVLLRATVIDFADDLLEHTRRPSARGSLWCIDCGRFVGRRALGYGQLYCSERCKKRAAKRRYRRRDRDAAVSNAA